MAEISERAITAAQVRAIHVALHRRGIDDEDYRALLRGEFDAGSCKDLTRRQASALLTQLGRPLRNPPGTPPPRPARTAPQPSAAAQPPPKGVARLATPLQRRFIADLVAEIAWRHEDGYRRWLKSNMGLARVATSVQAARVIEGLKALKRRASDVG